MKEKKSTNLEFDLISRWISKHLNNPADDFIYYRNRDVFVKMETREEKIEIPSKENIKKWQGAWLNVFEVCLYALQMKVNLIYRNGKKEGYIEELNRNEVRVGIEKVEIPYDHTTVMYAEALEKIISLYNAIKKMEKNINPISVNRSYITIDNPDRTVSEIKANVNTVEFSSSEPKISPSNLMTDKVAPFKPTVIRSEKVPSEPKVNPSSLMAGEVEPFSPTVIRSKQAETSIDKRRVQSVRVPLSMAGRKNATIKRGSNLEVQKIPMNMALDKDDCEKYRNQSLVVATCSSMKNDTTFRDNIDILQENLPSVSIASFISGKATNNEQAVKEATRMLRLLSECEVSKLVIYEINNDYINEHLDSKEDVLEGIESAFRICDVLEDGGYYPILCMDYETSEGIHNTLPQYKGRHAIVKCVTPKSKELVTPNDDILYMNPNSDNDMIIIADALIKSKIEEISREANRESYSMAA